MKHNYMTVLAVLGASCLSAAALETIQISATKKTADTRKSSSQQLPNGSTQLNQKSIFYRFDYRPMSPNLPKEAELQYVVLQENFNGGLEEATRGAQTVELTFGQKRSAESETFTLKEREWDRHAGGTGSMKQDVYGVGVRIVDREGEVLAAKYIPSSKQKDLEQALDRDPKKDKPKAPEGWGRDQMDRRPAHRKFRR